MRTPEPAHVLLLGTAHLHNPGLDAARPRIGNVLEPHHQRELEAIATDLVRFAPTRIAVEALPETHERLDRAYQAYRAGQHELGSNEIEQLGFRLAAHLDHPRLHPVDHPAVFPIAPVLEHAEANDRSFVQAFWREVRAWEREEEERLRTGTLRDLLRHLNHPATIARRHALYLACARVGAGTTSVGADLLSAWYDRNVRIFTNLLTLLEPGERVLAIVGAGHLAVLQALLDGVPGIERPDVATYLT